METTARKPIDWTDSYSKNHSKPFGAKVFDEIFTSYQDNVKEVEETPYEFLSQTESQGNYLFFNEGISPGSFGVDEILNWVDSGNTLFMSAEYFSADIMDTLNLNKEKFLLKNQFGYKPILKIDTLSNSYEFNRNEVFNYFENTDTLDVDVLGYVQTTKKDSTRTKHYPNFIKANFGNGKIYLHLFPKAFTNYFLVDSTNSNYTENILKNLDYSQTIYVDQNIKNQKEITSKHRLDYLLGNKYLKWAYYLILLTGLIYVFFEGKRKQKPIKVVKPFENKTYAFTKTISDMYYRKQDHKSIATKLIEHFFDYVRDQYLISTSILDDEFVKQLASKSGQSPKNIRKLLKLINNIEDQNSISKETLLRLEKQISLLKS